MLKEKMKQEKNEEEKKEEKYVGKFKLIDLK